MFSFVGLLCSDGCICSKFTPDMKSRLWQSYYVLDVASLDKIRDEDDLRVIPALL